MDIEGVLGVKAMDNLRDLLRKLTIPEKVQILSGEIKDLVPASRGSCIFKATWKGKMASFPRRFW